jgi:aminomethyltransferase
MQSPRRKTVFHAWHTAQRASMVNFAGWEMPLNYPRGIVEEHLTTRKFGGLFDVSHMGRIRVAGEDALPFLQWVLTNNAAAIDAGQAQYTILADAEGAALDDAYLYHLKEKEYLLVVNAANTEKDWAWLQEHGKKFSRLILEDRTEETAMVALQGPRSKSVLLGLLQGTENRLPDPGRNHLREATIQGTPVVLSRTGYTGEPIGFELFIPAAQASSVWEALLQEGAKEGICPVGLGARDTLRLEAGLPLYGHEFGLDPEGRQIPILAFPKAKIGISFSPVKGNFIGRDALWKQFQELKIREEAKGYGLSDPPLLPNRFFLIAVLTEGVVRPGFSVHGQDQPIGRVTSGTMVPFWKFSGKGIASAISEERGRRSIAIIYADAALKENQKIQIRNRGKSMTAVVVKRFLSSEIPPYARPVHYVEVPPPRPRVALPLRRSMETLTQRAKENTLWRQRQTVNLIPSEQTPSPLVRLLSILDPCARYAEHRHFPFLGDADVYYYQGTGFIEEVEEKLRQEMAHYLRARQVETRVISGQMANATVFSGLMDYLNRFDRKSNPRRLSKVLNHHIGRGGHLSSQPMGALRDFIAVDPQMERMAAVNFPVLEDNPYQIDLSRTEELLHQHRPELIIFGKSMVLHREPLREIRNMIEDFPSKPWILYDMAHVLGLIGPYFQQPFQEGADLVTGSTHKTFFGTQRGIISSNFEEDSEAYELWKAIERRTFPGNLSNHHLGTLVGLLAAAYEMNAFADEYPKQVIANAKAFARALHQCGLRVEGDPRIDFTETHQVLLRVGYGRGPEVARWAEQNNIVLNYQALPDDEGFSVSSGLRLGVQEMTRFGMKEKDFETLAELMAEVIGKGKSRAEEISRFRSKFLEMHYCLPAAEAEPLVRELLGIAFG